MVIVALQDDIDNLYAIYDTEEERFLGVNLGSYQAIGILMDYKYLSLGEATDRVEEHPQPFIDIAKHICENLE